MAEAIAGWARELSEVGGPNTLLWATEGAERQGYLDLTTSHPSGVSMLLAGRPTSLSDLLREAGTFEKARETARRIHAKAHELLEERGIVAGFVAIGIATWDPPRAHAVVEAPVLLRACTLRPTSPALHDFDLDLGAAVEVNPALINYLQSVAGLAVDPVALAALTDVRASAGGFDPYPAYAALGRLCADLPGFAVSPRLILGTYPYGKPDMVADVSGQGAWLAQVDLVAALAGDGDATTRLRQELPEPTENPDPQREVRPFDLDATQESVVEAVRAGRQLVLTAPAGTGSTQTVAAIVAALAHDGKRVLYVTARRESLHELTRRLADVGLGDLVLDLTGAAEDRRHVPAVLGAALTRVAELGQREGVVFVLENLNLEVDHPHTPFARAADVLALVQAVDSPHLRMMFDVYHAQIGEGNLIELLRASGPYLGEVQVADVPGRCEPGTGEINYPAIARALADLGYAGVVGLEGWAKTDSDLALARFREAFTLA